jgi:hypothetical protein
MTGVSFRMRSADVTLDSGTAFLFRGRQTAA